MKLEMRHKLARDPGAGRMRNVEQLIRLANASPRRNAKTTPVHAPAK